VALLSKLYIEKFDVWDHHAYGWPGIINYIKRFSAKNKKASVILEPALEYTFAQYRKKNLTKILYYEKNPWVAFAHHHPDDPRAFCRMESIINNTKNEKAISRCQGIFVLSEKQRQCYVKIDKLKNIPVSVLYHPVYASSLEFNTKCLLKSSQARNYPTGTIVSVGDHCRMFDKFSNLNTTMPRTVCLFQKDHWRGPRQAKRRDVALRAGGVSRYDRYYDNKTYYKMLRNNVHYAELWKPTASNYILECIERNIPIYVNPCDVVVEYLGNDYPFYMKSSINDMESDLNNTELIFNAHSYLKKHPFKEKFKLKNFLHSVVNSLVYKSL
jgi:hypothetical protein